MVIGTQSEFRVLFSATDVNTPRAVTEFAMAGQKKKTPVRKSKIPTRKVAAEVESDSDGSSSDGYQSVTAEVESESEDEGPHDFDYSSIIATAMADAEKQVSAKKGKGKAKQGQESEEDSEEEEESEESGDSEEEEEEEAMTEKSSSGKGKKGKSNNAFQVPEEDFEEDVEDVEEGEQELDGSESESEVDYEKTDDEDEGEGEEEQKDQKGESESDDSSEDEDEDEEESSSDEEEEEEEQPKAKSLRGKQSAETLSFLRLGERLISSGKVAPKHLKTTVRAGKGSLVESSWSSGQTNAIEQAAGASSLYDSQVTAAPAVNKQRVKIDRSKASLGKGWFDMAPKEIDGDMRADMKMVSMRNYLDPKRFYKNPDKMKKVLGVGTVIEGYVIVRGYEYV